MLPEQWTGLQSTTTEIDGEEHYKVQAIRKHCVVCGEAAVFGEVGRI